MSTCLLRLALVVWVVVACWLDPVYTAWWPGKDKPALGKGDKKLQKVGGNTAFELGNVAMVDYTGQKLLDELKTKISSSCWHQAYTTLFSSCSVSLKDPDKKMRLAYRFSNCFLEASGMTPLKKCPDMVPIKDCTKVMDENEHLILAKFFIEISSMCHHIQSDLFKYETEMLIDGLKQSSHLVEAKLESMRSQAQAILENTEKIAGTQQRLANEMTKLHEEFEAVYKEVNNNMGNIIGGLEELKKLQDRAKLGLEEFAKTAKERQFELQSTHKRLLEESQQIQVKTSNIISNLKTMKALLFYGPTLVLIHVVTGTEHTHSARAPLYFGVIATFYIEFWVIRNEAFNLPMYKKQPVSTALYVRGIFSVLALFFVLYCIATYRNVHQLSYSILLDLQEKLQASELIAQNLCDRYGVEVDQEGKLIKPSAPRRSARKKKTPKEKTTESKE